MTKLFCPQCGDNNTVQEFPSPNGGELFVAEDMDTDGVEMFDEAYMHKCSNCNTVFYMGDPTL